MSLTDSHCLGNLGHHGEDPSRQLLMTKIRHPKLILFTAWGGTQTNQRKSKCTAWKNVTKPHSGPPSAPHGGTQWSQTPNSVTRSPGTCYHREPPKDQKHIQIRTVLISHLLVPFSSPEPGSKKVTFLPSPGFFIGVFKKKKKKGHEHQWNHSKINSCCPKLHKHQPAILGLLTFK